MFCAPHTSIAGLHWQAVGPGPDPDVMLETRLNISGTLFRLMALRVPMPRSAGWTDNEFWEDNKSLQSDGLLWDEAYFKDFVRMVDAIPEDNRDPIEMPPERGLDEEMGRLSEAWRTATLRLGWDGEDWRPAVIMNSSYIVLGYPEGPGDRKLPAIEVLPHEARVGVRTPDRSYRFNLLIEGAACTLACAEMRLLTSDEIETARSMNPLTEGWISSMDDIMHSFPRPSVPTTFTVGGKTMKGYVLPADSEEWSFDIDCFMDVMSPGLMAGQMRWAFDIPMGKIDPGTSIMIEALATAVQDRRLVRSGNQAYLAARFPDVPRLLGTIDGDRKLMRSAINSRLGKAMLRGLGKGCEESPSFYTGRVVERVYIFPDRIYLGISNAFGHLANTLTPLEIRAASEGGKFLITPFDIDPSGMPSWVEALPIMVDRQIRNLIAGITDY